MENRTLAPRIADFREAANAPIVHSPRPKALKSSMARPGVDSRSTISLLGKSLLSLRVLVSFLITDH